MSARLKSLLLIDDDEQFLLPVGRALAGRGVSVWMARTFEMADEILITKSPVYVISELRVAGRWLIDYMNEVSAQVPAKRFAVVTTYPSVATAVQLTRCGIAAYFTKPISAEMLLDGLCRRPKSCGLAPRHEALTRPSLDRVIWEYLSQVCVSAGSVSEAARWLGVERHSLRRMLSKRPPIR
jgi:ActR/RegA family two-component response regulator